MNYCRTCKHWLINPNMIGAGRCMNPEAHIKMTLGSTPFLTAQNFGCVEHKEGIPEKPLYSADDASKIFTEFVASMEEAGKMDLTTIGNQ